MSNEEEKNNEEKSPEIKEEKNEGTESAKKILGNVVSSLLTLKQENPKVFFGLIGAVVLVILFLMIGGGDGSSGSAVNVNRFKIGSQYVLHNPNTYDKSARVRLVVTPGSTAAYDDTEKDSRDGCNTVPQDTPVTLLQFYDAFGKSKTFAKVRIEDGECKGTKHWTLSINLK
jgi:hypothetical protein